MNVIPFEPFADSDEQRLHGRRTIVVSMIAPVRVAWWAPRSGAVKVDIVTWVGHEEQRQYSFIALVMVLTRYGVLSEHSVMIAMMNLRAVLKSLKGGQSKISIGIVHQNRRCLNRLNRENRRLANKFVAKLRIELFTNVQIQRSNWIQTKWKYRIKLSSTYLELFTSAIPWSLNTIKFNSSSRFTTLCTCVKK